MEYTCKKSPLNEILNNLKMEKSKKMICEISPKDNLHLFVFVHGFQATSIDMRTIKNIVSLALPNALCLCSQANEEMTDGDIGEMGKKLAAEVKKHI